MGDGCSVTRNRLEGTEMRTTIAQRAHFSHGSSLASRENVRYRNSGSPVVAMMQAAEPGHYDDFASSLRVTHCYTTGRCFLRQREMSSIVVIIADVITHKALQMAFIQDDHMVEQIASAVANPSLGNAVLPWTSITRPLGLDAKHLHCVDQFLIELRAAIKDKITRCGVVRKCLAQLLNCPSSGRMLSYIAMKDAPPVMRDNKEAVKHAKSQRRHGKEIHGSDSFTMVAQKCRPPLCRLWTSRRFPHPAQHCSLGNLEAQHFEFAMDARRTPGRVLDNHAEDKFTHFFSDAFSSRSISTPREPRPIQLESRLVPAHDSPRLDENQRLLPSRPKPPQHHPEQFVLSGKPWLRMLLFQNSELLTKRQIFQQKIMSGSEGTNKQGKQELQRTEHLPVVSEKRSDLLPLKNQAKFIAVVKFVAAKASKNLSKP